MKRKTLVLALLSMLLLCACAQQRTDTRAEELQACYAAMTECAARAVVSIADETQTRRYDLAILHTADGTRITVLEPEALAGVSAMVGNDEGLTLSYDGMVLPAGQTDGRVSAVTAVPLLFRAAAEGQITERGCEAYDGTDALRLCFETEEMGEKRFVTTFFDTDDKPLYAEIECAGEILAYLEFTEFQFGDILSADKN